MQSKEEKRLYDQNYRRVNKEKIKKKKAEYNQTENGKASAKKRRHKRRPYHLEYCRTESYREKKKEYDKINRFKYTYGEFWECMLLVSKINNIVCEMVPTKYERSIMRGIIRKNRLKQAQKRHLLYGWSFNY